MSSVKAEGMTQDTTTTTTSSNTGSSSSGAVIVNSVPNLSDHSSQQVPQQQQQPQEHQPQQQQAATSESTPTPVARPVETEGDKVNHTHDNQITGSGNGDEPVLKKAKLSEEREGSSEFNNNNNNNSHNHNHDHDHEHDHGHGQEHTTTETITKPSVNTPEWHRLRKISHKEVERRRRESINLGIKELSQLLPQQEANKAQILRNAIDYIKRLKDNEDHNIEKWTLEKLLTDQAVSELASSNEKLKQELEKAYREIEHWKKLASTSTTTTSSKPSS